MHRSYSQSNCILECSLNYAADNIVNEDFGNYTKYATTNAFSQFNFSLIENAFGHQILVETYIGLRLEKVKQWKNVSVALNLTRCIPWFYPVPDNSSIKMCDPWEAKAFQNLIGKVPPELCNHCLPDCNKNIFRASVSAAPFRICDHTNLGTRYGQKAFLFCWPIFLWKGHYLFSFVAST